MRSLNLALAMHDLLLQSWYAAISAPRRLVFDASLGTEVEESKS